MSGDAGDEQTILECIEEADRKAGDDDAAFIAYLNECYAARERETLHASAGLTLRGVASPLDRSPRAQQIHLDQRFLRNARSLAQRTLGGLRVIGGMRVPAGEFLDCVAVGNDRQWGCTGTLIAPDTVVTAGHCASFATRVFFGNDVAKAGRIVRVRERVRHPDYHKKGKQNDLMVLRLDEAVDSVTPRKLATAKLINGATDGRVVGFGNTDPMGSTGYGVKRQVDVPIASAACRGTLDDEPDSAAYGCDKELELVAGKPLLAKDSCTGDSGGPFYVEGPDGGWVLAGATSRATNSAPNDCGDGGIYVRLDKYRKWIDSVPGVVLR